MYKMSLEHLVWNDSRKLSKFAGVLPKGLRNQRWDNLSINNHKQMEQAETHEIYLNLSLEKKKLHGHSLVDEKEPTHYFEIQ